MSINTSPGLKTFGIM